MEEEGKQVGGIARPLVQRPLVLPEAACAASFWWGLLLPLSGLDEGQRTARNFLGQHDVQASTGQCLKELL